MVQIGIKQKHPNGGTATASHPVHPWGYAESWLESSEHTCMGFCLKKKIRTECFALLIFPKTPFRELLIK